MGTKGGKPLSTLEKRQRKIVKEEARKGAKEDTRGKKTAPTQGLDPTMIAKALDEINNSGFTTPFTLSQKLGVKYSIAKKLIRELIKNDGVKLLAKNRHVILVSKK